MPASLVMFNRSRVGILVHEFCQDRDTIGIKYQFFVHGRHNLWVFRV